LAIGNAKVNYIIMKRLIIMVGIQVFISPNPVQIAYLLVVTVM
jgi:hypothetical protein